MSRSLQSVLLSFLLLIAQHGALTHGLHHAQAASAAHAQHDDDAPELPSTLCDFHLALAGVLGAVDAAAPVVLLPVQSAERAVVRLHSLHAARLLVPAARGPPAFS